MTIPLSALVHLGAPLSLSPAEGSAAGLALVPLFPRQAPALAFLDAASALAQGALRVAEQSPARVDALELHHTGPLPVLVGEGCLLVGGRQDRLTLAPAWLEAGQQAELHVHCVEQARWSPGPRGATFETSRAGPAIRHALARGPHEQGETWRQVRDARQAHGLAPDGSLAALAPSHDNHRLAPLDHSSDLAPLDLPTLPWGACGVMVLRAPGLGPTTWPLVEWYADPAAFRGAWPALAASLLSEHAARLRHRGLDPRQVRAPWVRLSEVVPRLAKVAQAAVVERRPLGPRAQALRLRRQGASASLQGWATRVDGQPVHLGLVHG